MPYPREMTPLPPGIDPAMAPGWAGKSARVRKALRERGFFVPRSEREKAEFVLANALHHRRPIKVRQAHIWRRACAGIWKGAITAACLALGLAVGNQANLAGRLLLLSTVIGLAGAAVCLLTGRPSEPSDPKWPKEREYCAVASSAVPPRRWPEQSPDAFFCWPHLVLRELLLAICAAAIALAGAIVL